MKPLIIALIVLFAVLQYRLWFASDGFNEVFHLKHAIAEQATKNQELQQRNLSLLNEITSLKKGGSAIENRARNELGMIKKDEVFYQITK